MAFYIANVAISVAWSQPGKCDHCISYKYLNWTAPVAILKHQHSTDTFSRLVPSCSWSWYCSTAVTSHEHHSVSDHWPFKCLLISLFRLPSKKHQTSTLLTLCDQWLVDSFHHYNDVIMGTIASQITSLMIVYSTVYSDANQRKHQSSASLAFVQGIHWRPVNSPHKWPVVQKIFPFDDVIMKGPVMWEKIKSYKRLSQHSHKISPYIMLSGSQRD